MWSPPLIPLPATKWRPLPIIPAASGRAGILGRDGADFILQRLVQVQDAGIAVVGIEDRGPAGFAGGIGLAPMQLDFLMRVALDRRDAHPDAGRALRRIPLLDLIGQGVAAAVAEADVLAVGLAWLKSNVSL